MEAATAHSEDTVCQRESGKARGVTLPAAGPVPAGPPFRERETDVEGRAHVGEQQLLCASWKRSRTQGRDCGGARDTVSSQSCPVRSPDLSAADAALRRLRALF